LKLAGFALATTFIFLPSTLQAFEGRIQAAITQGNQMDGLLYTIGTNFLRVEMTATNWPNPVDILDRNSGALMLLYPHNRSFVRLKPVPESSSAIAPGFPPMPAGLPPGVGPQSRPPGVAAMPKVLQPRYQLTSLPPVSDSTNFPGMPTPPMPPTPNTPTIDLQYIVTSAGSMPP